MDIGEPQKIIIAEPLEEPVPEEIPAAPEPVREPEPVPA